MLQYTIKRLLLVPPTFFFVSLIIFLVLNVAPGRPGASGSADSPEQQGTEQKESYRIFKEQFNLDKPILLNTRFSMEQGEVRRMLEVAHNIGGTYKASERIKAQDDLDDFGNFLVRHLIVIVAEDSDMEIRRQAARQLTQAAQMRFLSETRCRSFAPISYAHCVGAKLGLDKSFELFEDPPFVTAEAKQRNREISKRNQVVKGWHWAPDADEETVASVTKSWVDWYAEHDAEYTYAGSDKASIFFTDTRFWKYWSNLVQLDFGVSTADRRPVLPTLLSKVKYSLSLALTSVLLAYMIAVPLGIFSAVRQNTVADSVITVIIFILFSLPTFFTGTVWLRLMTEGDPFAWFPTGGFQSMSLAGMTTWDRTVDVVWHLVLPIITYTAASLAALSRYARTGVIDVIRADYIRTARAKGLSEPVVIIKHAARNGMIPVLTLLGGLLPVLVGGSVVIEVIFNIPGMGRYLFDAINLRDYNVVMAVLLASSGLALFGILVSDLSYALADPRISFD